ncbi:hypothetical protein Pan216_54480 [Planctomycetes bacterium Pan216]|uniref:Uncharacterized protein n=1 Tax=Kolteria novifilia TaxID=2527975 RepID=A0A518BC43_9BACT|nr:hypothetical protein Pan216_54480 [Planctomycetes bacterium Pan216]
MIKNRRGWWVGALAAVVMVGAWSAFPRQAQAQVGVYVGWPGGGVAYQSAPTYYGGPVYGGGYRVAPRRYYPGTPYRYVRKYDRGYHHHHHRRPCGPRRRGW